MKWKVKKWCDGIECKPKLLKTEENLRYFILLLFHNLVYNKGIRKLMGCRDFLCFRIYFDYRKNRRVHNLWVEINYPSEDKESWFTELNWTEPEILIHVKNNKKNYGN